MSYLKDTIDRILGSSLRCLLPSYWWKRIFGLLVDEIDDVRSTANIKANKSDVTSLSKSVDALSDKVDKIDSGNNITVDSELSYESTNPVQNKVVTMELLRRPVSTCVVTDKITDTETYEGVIKRNTEALNSWIISAQLGNFDSWTVINDETNRICSSVYVQMLGTMEVVIYVFVEGVYKAYRLYRDGRCTFVGNVDLPSASSGLPIYVALGNASLTAEQIAANKYARDNIYKEIPYAIYIINDSGQTYSIKYPIVQWSGDVFYVTDWDSGSPLNLIKHTIKSDGTVTVLEETKAPIFFVESTMSSTSVNPVQSKVIKAYVDGKIAEIPVVTVDSELSDTSENPIQNKVIKAYVDESIATSITNALNTEV